MSWLDQYHDTENHSRQTTENDPFLQEDDVPNRLNNISEEGHEIAQNELSHSSMGVMLESIAEHASHLLEGARDITMDVSENIHDVASTVKEAFVDEVRSVAGTFKDDLQEADGGELYFLDMSLTRNLSILPSDIAGVAVRVPSALNLQQQTEDSERTELLKQHSTLTQYQESTIEEKLSTPLSAYFLLATAVVSLSSIGPLLDLQKEASPAMKIYWRMAGTALLLIPFAATRCYHTGLPQLQKAQWITFLLSTFFFDASCLGFVLALEYTSVGNAVILTNSQALILLAGKFFVGSPVSLVEGSGAIIAFAGAILCTKDSSDQGPSGSNTVLGDVLSIVSALGGVGYLVFAKTIRPHMCIFVFMFLTMAVGCIMLLLFQIFVMKESVSFGMDPNTGIWGFLNLEPDRLPLEITMVVICNLFGTMGYVRAMQYFENLVISTAGLMEPVVAEFMAFAFGVGFLPGWKGWVGNVLVACGTFAVIYPSSQGKSVSLHH